jgi:hypothetical protein
MYLSGLAVRLPTLNTIQTTAVGLWICHLFHHCGEIVTRQHQTTATKKAIANNTNKIPHPIAKYAGHANLALPGLSSSDICLPSC